MLRPGVPTSFSSYDFSKPYMPLPLSSQKPKTEERYIPLGYSRVEEDSLYMESTVSYLASGSPSALPLVMRLVLA